MQKVMLSVSHGSDLDLHTLQHAGLYVNVLNVLPYKSAVGADEVVVLQYIPHAHNLVGTQGDHVGNAPHEGEAVGPLWSLPLFSQGVDFPVGQARGSRHEGISDKQTAVKEEDH